jgi:hypothetical protein
MHGAHALNLLDSVHTMLGMESPKPSGHPAPPGARPNTLTIRRQSRQQFAQQRSQQPLQQQ